MGGGLGLLPDVPSGMYGPALSAGRTTGRNSAPPSHTCTICRAPFCGRMELLLIFTFGI